MSLHCPATLLVTSPERLPELDRAGLAQRRIAGVYADADEPGTGIAAAEPAAALKVPVRSVAGLGAAAENERDVHNALESIADLHRGETVLVVGRALAQAIPLLGLPVHVAETDVPGASVGAASFTTIECGDDGWAIVTRAPLDPPPDPDDQPEPGPGIEVEATADPSRAGGEPGPDERRS